MGTKKIVGGVRAAALLLMGAGAFSACGSAQVSVDGGAGGAAGGRTGSGGSTNAGGKGGPGGGGQSGGSAAGGSAGQRANGGAAGSAAAGASGAAGLSGAAGAGAGGSAGGGAHGGSSGAGGSASGGAAGASAGGASGGAGGRAGGTAGNGAAGTGAAGNGAAGTGGTGPGGSTGAAGNPGAGGYNLVFVTSQTNLTTNLGSAAAYDAICNQLATAAGINDAAGSAFVALVGDAQGSPVARLGNARGFVRTDGAPVADDLSSLFSGYRMFNPIRTDEHGVLRPGTAVLTGLGYDGSVAADSDCAGWTTAGSSANVTAGYSLSGPTTWLAWEGGPCSTVATGAVYCFMKTRSSALVVTPVAGKKIFLTNGPVAVGADADASCAASKPPGTGAVSALRATTTTAASSLLTMTAKYVRPDGILVGLGSDLVAAIGGNSLASGVWQQGDGSYVNTRAVWTGATSLTATGTMNSTCSNWTSTASTAAITGATSSTEAGFWDNPLTWPCDNTYTWSYCVER
jgi:hypothetical protein